MRKTIFILGIALLALSCNKKQKSTDQVLQLEEVVEVVEENFYSKLNPEDFSTEIKNKEIQLLDVRTAEEYADGNIAGSLHVDFDDKEALYQTLENLDKTQPVYIYCRTGNKSGQTADIMKEMGFYQVIDLEGGYQEGM